MATLSEIQTRVSEAVTALDGGDYAEALRLCRGAAMLLAVVPNSEFQGEKMEFDREAIKNQIAELSRAAQAAAFASNGGVVTQDIQYRRG